MAKGKKRYSKKRGRKRKYSVKRKYSFKKKRKRAVVVRPKSKKTMYRRALHHLRGKRVAVAPQLLWPPRALATLMYKKVEQQPWQPGEANEGMGFNFRSNSPWDPDHRVLGESALDYARIAQNYTFYRCRSSRIKLDVTMVLNTPYVNTATYNGSGITEYQNDAGKNNTLIMGIGCYPFQPFMGDPYPFTNGSSVFGHRINITPEQYVRLKLSALVKLREKPVPSLGGSIRFGLTNVVDHEALMGDHNEYGTSIATTSANPNVTAEIWWRTFYYIRNQTDTTTTLGLQGGSVGIHTQIEYDTAFFGLNEIRNVPVSHALTLAEDPDVNGDGDGPAIEKSTLGFSTTHALVTHADGASGDHADHGTHVHEVTPPI